MFKLIVGMFMMVNGQVSDDPAASFERRVQFPTEASCMGFYETEQGAVEKHTIDTIAASKGAVIKFSCIKSEEETL